MSGSCCNVESAGKFFSFFARGYRKRFEKKGFEVSQQQLLAGLEQVGYEGAALLEIGCGVGHLHQSLLEKGASTATGIDLATKMLSEATDWADERGLSDRVNYIEGDFMELAQDVEQADICVMDKVVCCYPDARGLVEQSLAKTRRAYALTYPRDRWFVRLSIRIWNTLLWVLRADFRSFVHDPDQIEAWITGAGFEKRFEDRTAFWLSQVYVRP
jgi:hypothetical protein